MAKRKPCAVPLCPALRAKGSYVCVAHKQQKGAKAHKFHAQPTTIGDIRFDSKAESRRWVELCILQKTGQIRHLVRQPVFPLHALPTPRTDPQVVPLADYHDLLIGTALMDFGYEQAPDWKLIVEDVKGIDNSLSRWKRRHVLLEYGIVVQIIKRQ